MSRERLLCSSKEWWTISSSRPRHKRCWMQLGGLSVSRRCLGSTPSPKNAAEQPFRHATTSMVGMYGTTEEHDCRMHKKAVQQGRSKRRPKAYLLRYVEGLND